MKTSYRLESAGDIDKVVYDILKQSKSFDIFPTPIGSIVQFAELLVDKNTGLHDIPNHYISKKIDVLKNALSKIFGALDRRKKIIYLEPGMGNGKKAFVQLHEVGHHSLPWQRDIFEYVEDELSLSPDVQEQFEVEANYFASAALFQLERFEQDAARLPLEMATVKYLAAKYGASIQATFRRYVEKTHKRTALLVLTKPTCFGEPLPIRNWFMSKKFAASFPDLQFQMPAHYSRDWPFVQDYYKNRKWIDQPQSLSILVGGECVGLEYRYFFNMHNVFLLLTPPGEKIASNTTFVVS